MKTIICCILAASILFFSCTKSTPKAAAALKNPIEGSVLLYDEGDSIYSMHNCGGMQVSIEPSTPEISTTTNDSGNIRFSCSADDLPENFAVIFSRSDYGTFKKYFKKSMDGVHVYNIDGTMDTATYDLVLNETLGKKSTVTVNSFSISRIDSNTTITCNVTTPNVEGKKYIRLFYQKNVPSFTFENIPRIYNKTFSAVLPVKNGDNTINLCTECWKSCAGYHSGDTLYITAYGDSWVSNFYTDIYTGEFMMPNVNTSNHVPPVQYIIP